MSDTDEAVLSPRSPTDATSLEEPLSRVEPGRLRRLPVAMLDIARAGDLDAVLDQLLGTARGLTQARYGAVAVLRHGRLARFVHAGMDEETVAAIARLPEGKGILGRLIDYPEPLRLADLSHHMSSAGVPDHHPPMDTFLGVPIHLGESVFANLYLTEKRGGVEFTEADEQIVVALARTAAVAIGRTIDAAEARHRHAWQAAMIDVTTTLLGGGDGDAGLDVAARHLAHHARIAAAAKGAGLAVGTDEPETLRIAYAEGTHQRWLDARLPRDGSIPGAALAAGRAVLIADPALDPRTAVRVRVAGADELGETLAVPVATEAAPAAVLIVSRSRGDEPFEEADVDLITAYAHQAGLALGRAHTRRDTEQLHLVEDRQHIAEDLQQRVVRRLFGLGLTLQAAVPRIGNETAAGHVRDGVDELDAIIRDIRSAVFSLNHDNHGHDSHGHDHGA
jgi:GAF domain-containing protein